VVFTPNASFIGGWVNIEYQLSDESGHASTSWVNIEFPVIIKAQDDYVDTGAIETTTIDVLANDTITDGSSGTVLLQSWDSATGETIYVTHIESSDGNWTVENDNQVTFTPNADFSGETVGAEYQLSDNSNHSDIAYININFFY
jgi:CshA-type fibril repeat protein